MQDNYFDFVNNHSEGQDGETNRVDDEFAFMPSNKEQVSVNNSLDIMLHDLLLKHKASLLLYDKISNLFNNYLTSPDFDRFTKHKTSKALIRSTQKSMNTECLQPMHISLVGIEPRRRLAPDSDVLIKNLLCCAPSRQNALPSKDGRGQELSLEYN